MQLPDEVQAEITELCQEGDALAGLGELLEAKQRYIEALRLLPGDHRGWAAATWIYVAIGDVHFRLGVHDRAFKCFRNAVQCPDGLGNPYIHLRLGQTAFELGDHDRAADELVRAYMGDGPGIFEEDDPKYLAFLGTRTDLEPTPGSPSLPATPRDLTAHPAPPEPVPDPRSPGTPAPSNPQPAGETQHAG